MTDRDNQFCSEYRRGDTEISVAQLGAQIADIENKALQSSSRLDSVKRNLSFNSSDYANVVAMNRWKRRLVVTGLAAAVLLTIGAVMLFTSSGRIEARIMDRQIMEGDWVSSTFFNPATLSFSDGSSVAFSGQGSARVQQLNTGGAHILVEGGTVEASIAHRSNTDWLFSAGPYRIKVTGTRFTVSWRANEARLGLKIHEGSVEISGPMITERIEVSAGEALTASLPSGRLEYQTRRGDDIGMSEQRKPADLPDSVNHPPPKNNTPANKSASRSRVVTKPHLSESWLILARNGQYEQAVREAQKLGISKIFKSAGSTELILLGDAARHSGNTSMATNIYKQVRKVYRGTASASSATFALGVMAYHQQRDLNAAASWFKQLLKQKGNSGLKREAMGRLIEVSTQIGQDTQAQAYARDYLSLYPSGPHAALARRVLQ